MEHILSLSYGKDSLACLGAIQQLGWPLDRIVHAEVWATGTVPADLPPMIEFKKKADKVIYERYGITVEHVKGKNSYQDLFYRIRPDKAKFHPGEIRGWPVRNISWCNGSLKLPLLKASEKSGNIVYIGIACDEPNRFHNLTDKKKSPLVVAGWDEAYCRQWCEENDLLSPIYTSVSRGGCWFCHNQGVNQLRMLRKYYPDLWALMLKWDADSPTSFHSDGHTVLDFDKRFQLEDAGFIKPDEKFSWRMLDEELNYRWF